MAMLLLKDGRMLKEHLKKELEWDPESAPAYHGLGLTYLRRGRYDLAADSFLNAVGLSYHFPFAHYHLGEALYYLMDYQRASEAFEVCLRMAPNVNKARQWLAKIYEEHLGLPEKAEMYKSAITEHFKGTITIVSGLPRSGTSMMMPHSPETSSKLGRCFRRMRHAS